MVENLTTQADGPWSKGHSPTHWNIGPIDAIESIRHFDSKVKAFVPDSLCLPARVEGHGPLSGATFAVKDNLNVRGFPTLLGSSTRPHDKSSHDADIVAQLLQLGGAFVGKTTMAEFALFQPPITYNPRARRRTPGGSSTGSAAAVAARLATFSVGTQTAGSIIRPAAYCSVAGYKPTFGRVSRNGMHQLSESLDTIGFFASTVSDLCRLAAMLFAAEELWFRDVSGIRIGVIEGWDEAMPSGAARLALRHVAEQARLHGAFVIHAKLPSVLIQAHHAHRTIMAYEGSRNLEEELRQHFVQLSPKLIDFIVEGQRLSLDDYHNAVSAAKRAIVHADTLFDSFDVLLTPSALGVPPVRSSGTGSSAMNRLWTLLGVPTVNLPFKRQPRALPLGIQVIARREADETALQVASYLEKSQRSLSTRSQQ